MREKEVKFVVLVFVLMVVMFAVAVLFVGPVDAKCKKVSCGMPFPHPGRGRGIPEWVINGTEKDPSCNPAPDWFGENCLPEGWYCSADGSECWPPGGPAQLPPDKGGELVCPMPEFPEYCYRSGGGK